MPFAPYRLAYQYALKPLGVVKPHRITDNPEPHRFAMMVGAVVNGVATVALWLNVALLGWLLVGVVVVLANLNFWVNFCAGCWMYYQLHKIGVPGFTQAPLPTSKG